MKEKLKDPLIMLLLVMCVVFLAGMIGSCNNARGQKSARDKEMAARLDLEEKIDKFTQEKTSTEAAVQDLTKALEEEKLAHEATKKVLTQEQLITSSLKDELQKLTKIKEALEHDLKDARATTMKTPAATTTTKDKK